MTLNSLDDLLKDQIRDIYNAETQWAKVLPKFAKSTNSLRLQNAFEGQVNETREQVRRLDRIGDVLGFKPTGKTCLAMKGLIDEAVPALNESNHAAVHDANLISAALRIEAYKITAYGVSRELAEVLGYDEVANSLDKSLDEETADDRALSTIFKEAVIKAPLDAAAMRTCPDLVKNDERRDPLSGEHGAHAIGTGIGGLTGVTMGAGTGAVLGAIGGPFTAILGAGIGGTVGAIAGGMAGKSVAEEFNPTIEHSYWRRTYARRPYVHDSDSYEMYAPAYQYGWEAYGKFKGKQFKEIERELELNWNNFEGSTALTWERAKEAVRDSWDRLAGKRGK